MLNIYDASGTSIKKAWDKVQWNYNIYFEWIDFVGKCYVIAFVSGQLITLLIDLGAAFMKAKVLGK